MPKDFVFTTEYTLDKAFFAECYDQTNIPVTLVKAYFKSLFFLLLGGALINYEFLPSGHVGWFFIVLSFIEALSVYFKRAWWLWRQNISMSSGSKVEFHIDSKGVSYKSSANTRSIAWNEIDQLEQSNLGFILHIGKQRQYVSKSCLSDKAIAFIIDQFPLQTK